MGYEIKAKTAVGTTKKVAGKIEVLKAKRGESFSFKNLQGSLKGKILVCQGKVSKGVLEKARALGVLGIVCKDLDDEQLSQLKRELRSSWSPSLFALLITQQKIEDISEKIEGKMGAIEVEKKRLVIEV